MILYFSSSIKDDYFSQMVKEKKITAGHQAQKFNSLIIKGLSAYTDVCAISNPPYNSFVCAKSICDCDEKIKYCVLGSNQGRLHKVLNYLEMRSLSLSMSREEKPEAIVCDAINPLASLNALQISRKYKIPAIAIITDIPEKLRSGNKLFRRFASFLMKKYHGYVVLTEAMIPFVNKKNRPYIVVEGSCEDSETLDKISKSTDNRFTCVYAGSIAPLTGIEELVQSVALINSEDFELNIYGNGKLADWIVEQRATDDRINYYGIVTNAEAVQAQRDAKLLINPRPDNIVYGNLSFPSKIMEYMASGTPLLTTKLPGIPSEYFDYLYTIDDCSAEGIAKAISDVISIPSEEREKKGQSAREFVLREKNNVKQAGRIMALIEEIKNK